MKKLLTIVCLIALCSASAWAQKPDPRVKAALESNNTKYTITNSGNYYVKFRSKSGRTHRAYIESNTTKYFDLEIREVYAVIYESKTPFDKKIARKLLEDASTRKMGGWKYLKTSSGLHLLYFSIKIDANASGKKLFSYTDFVTLVADEMEKKIFKTDKY